MAHVDWFNVATLPALIGVKNAMEFIMTVGPLSATEADELGLITKAVPDDELEASIEEITTSLKEAHSMTLRRVKQSIYASMNMSLGSAYLYAQNAMQNLRENLEYKEGFQARYENRDVDWSKE